VPVKALERAAIDGGFIVQIGSAKRINPDEVA